MNPYKINEPAKISFSGGRSSAYMLYRVLEANNGLPKECKVVFANTGKEMPETLDFVRDCSNNWGIEITWLEFQGLKEDPKIVTRETASLNGEPFALLITQKKYLPNPVARFCTSELKVVLMHKYMDILGVDSYIELLGIRADEPRRVAKQRSKPGIALPLADDGVSARDVQKFWDKQNFDLQLKAVNGVCNWSNCDLCYLKGGKIKLSIIKSNPKIADWWIEQEKKIGNKFRSDKIDYQTMQVIASDQGDFFGFDDETIPCYCGD